MTEQELNQARQSAGDRRDWDALDKLEKQMEKAAQTKPSLTKAEIQAQKNLRRQLCAEAIQQACDYYECDIVAVPYQNGNKIEARLELVLK